MEITLKNGDKKHFDKAASCKDIALSISEGLARAAVCAKVDGTLVDLSAVVDRDCEFEIVTLKDKEGLEVYRHTASHVLAQADKAS